MRAGMLALRGRHDQAAAEYRRALDSDPIDPPALIAVLQDCRRRRAVAEAIETATQALSLDPSNFTALDGLAWAYLQQGDHRRAKPVVERAVQAFDALNTSAAFKGVSRFLIGALRLLARLPGLRSHLPTVPPTSELEQSAAHGLANWRTWALDYLAWHRVEYDSTPTGEHH